MELYFFLVLALLLVMTAGGAACGATESLPPAATDGGSESTTPEAAVNDSGSSTPARVDGDPESTIPAAVDGGSEFATPAAVDSGSESATPMPTAYEGLLGAIPDTPEARTSVYINDYALARRLFDPIFPVPGPGDDEEAVAQFNTRLPPMGRPPEGEAWPVMSFGNHSFFGPVNHRRVNFQHFAFDARNLDQSIAAGPGAEMDVARGRFDTQAADKALGTCSECSAPSREEHRGVPYYSWGADNEIDDSMKFAPPAFDGLGRGGRIAVLDEYVFRTLATDAMNLLIDAHLNEAPSLADVEEFRLLASGMSRLGGYSIFLSGDVGILGIDESAKLEVGGRSPTQEQIDEMRAKLANPGLLRPYQAVGFGGGKDEDGAHMALVLVHADDGSAEDNVALLRRRIEEGSSIWFDAPWSDVVDVDALEIYTDGRLLLAKLKGDISLKPFDWYDYRDNLILHE